MKSNVKKWEKVRKAMNTEFCTTLEELLYRSWDRLQEVKICKNIPSLLDRLWRNKFLRKTTYYACLRALTNAAESIGGYRYPKEEDSDNISDYIKVFTSWITGNVRRPWLGPANITNAIISETNNVIIIQPKRSEDEIQTKRSEHEARVFSKIFQEAYFLLEQKTKAFRKVVILYKPLRPFRESKRPECERTIYPIVDSGASFQARLKAGLVEAADQLLNESSSFGSVKADFFVDLIDAKCKNRISRRNEKKIENDYNALVKGYIVQSVESVLKINPHLYLLLKGRLSGSKTIEKYCLVQTNRLRRAHDLALASFLDLISETAKIEPFLCLTQIVKNLSTYLNVRIAIEKVVGTQFDEIVKNWAAKLHFTLENFAEDFS